MTLWLSSLENLLKYYIKKEDYPKLFLSQDFTLKFNGQAAPITKWENQKLIQEVPEDTLQYTKNAHQKLHTPAPKRLAEEFEQ